MNSNQRSEMNNQSNNGGNEKGTPGSKGATTDGPLDHTWPQAGAPSTGSMGSQQSASRGGTQGGGQRGPLSGQQAAQGGSMGSQQSGMQSGTQGGGQSGHGTGTPTVKQSGSMSADQTTTDRSGSQTGSEQRDASRTQSNDTTGGLPRSPGGTGPTNARQDSHLTGAQVHANQQKEMGGVHKSNDAAGGYPKSPGGANKLAADEKMDDDTGFSNQ